MVDFARIQDHPTLIRDLRSQAILSIDSVAVRRHEKRITELQKETARDAEIGYLKTQMTEIKTLLMQLSNNQIQKTA
jgi:hypothetical protein